MFLFNNISGDLDKLTSNLHPPEIGQDTLKLGCGMTLWAAHTAYFRARTLEFMRAEAISVEAQRGAGYPKMERELAELLPPFQP